MEEEKNALLDYVEENVDKREIEADQVLYMQQEKDTLIKEKAMRDVAFVEMQSNMNE